MTVENKPAAPAAPTAPPAQARGKATSPSAPGAAGFLALLNAADGALATLVDGAADDTPGNRSALDGADTPDGKDGLVVLPLADAPIPDSALVQEEDAVIANARAHTGPATTASTQRDSGLVPDATASAAVRGAAAASKPGKSMTAQLAEEPAKSRWAAQASQAAQDAASQKTEPIVARVLMENMPQTSVEHAPAAMQLVANERKMPEFQGQKLAPTAPVYFQPQASSAPLGMDGVVATGAAAPLDTYVAEQVSYWITQDVQNAELTLDGVGHSPVEVSISMQGNEAQVAFHTDELAARDALQNASEQLRDMLQRQGLVLAGVSVGNAQTGEAGQQQQRRSRQDGRQGMVVSAESVVGSADSRRMQPAAGSAVDLFV
jgi:flagellar hook-length control protein FliK